LTFGGCAREGEARLPLHLQLALFVGVVGRNQKRAQIELE
jgi:hypothetical protein